MTSREEALENALKEMIEHYDSVVISELDGTKAFEQTLSAINHIRELVKK